MLAVIRELENWRHLLEGVKFKFKIWMDYKKFRIFYESAKVEQKTSHILKNEELRMEIIQLHYDVLTAGHREKWKTTELVM